MKLPRSRPQVFDPSRLRHLTEELDSPESARCFLETFLDMLPQRIECICTALDQQDAKASREAVLSLRTSSAMVGAFRMEYDAGKLERAILDDHLPAAARAERLLARDAEELTRALIHATPSRPSTSPQVTKGLLNCQKKH